MRIYSFRFIVILFALFTAVIMAGGWYVWSTLHRVETELPMTALVQHRELSTMIEGLSRLAAALDAVRVNATDERLAALTISLDIAYYLRQSFAQNLPSNHCVQ